MNATIEQTFIQPVSSISVPKEMQKTGFRVVFQALPKSTEIDVTQPLSQLVKKWQLDKQNSHTNYTEDWSDAFDFEDPPEKEEDIF